VNLVAGLVVRNELSRYLELCIDSLLEFCDEVRVIDDRSTDGSYEYLISGQQVARKISAIGNRGPGFYEHEGRLRQQLLEWTLGAEPTHILAIDADEFIADGRMVRQSLEHQPQQEVWTLGMQEIWKADEGALWIRSDGGWRAHETTALFRVPDVLQSNWGIADKQLSCGREPVYVRNQFRSALRTGTEILHFGWTNESERIPRYERYAVADGGRFHASAHLQSILFEDRRVRLKRRGWPVALVPRQHELLERVRETR
jgi:glycosyltransferase involved in cell wall biosynthesis